LGKPGWAAWVGLGGEVWLAWLAGVLQRECEIEFGPMYLGALGEILELGLIFLIFK
jgi:hypothetical protein